MMIRKRDGRVVEFDETKITDAIFEAAKSVGGADRQLAMELTLNVLKALKNENKQTVDVEHIQDIVEKVQRLHQRLANIRTDYINKTVFSIVKQKPSYITIEDLAVSNMMKNKHLSKAIASQKFFEFKTKLMSKCKQNDVELRIVDRFYPSSKTCSQCGKIKKDLKLSNRIYKCNCGLDIDRDLNASINLKNAKEYKIA